MSALDPPPMEFIPLSALFESEFPIFRTDSLNAARYSSLRNTLWERERERENNNKKER